MCGRVLVILTAIAASFDLSVASAEDRLPRDEAARALKRAVEFFRRNVSAEGGYLWRYAADLSAREGEGEASPMTAWVQPPGTPSVGGAFLRAYELTGDRYYLEAARETAHALVRGQLQSGGWDYRIEFDPKERRRYAYRVDSDSRGNRNVTTLDDDTTQSALRYLMRVDRALEFEDEAIHEAAEYALESLLQAQYPNGAWPQRYSAPPDPARYPVKKADYPESWSRTWPREDYRDYYTFNDNTIADTIGTMLEAAAIYGDSRYAAAAEKAGDFILLAQMPDPQPAWAQQYNREMHPAWARKFEPPAVTGGESQGILRVLMNVYRETGKRKYLEPIPRALDYLKRSALPDGRLARFYELRTNRPLYFTQDYELTYQADDLPTHYAFIVSSRLASIEREYRRLAEAAPATLKRSKRRDRIRLTSRLAERAEAAVAALDERGAWTEWGRLRRAEASKTPGQIIDSRTFLENVETLAEYVAAE